MSAISAVINGVNLQKVANLIIDQPGSFDVNSLKPGDIIFCKTDYIGVLFSALLSGKKEGPYKLVTHCSDYSIDENIFKVKPACISKWFAQNANYQHPDLIPVPIGLENHEGFNKGGAIVPDVLDLPLIAVDKSNSVYCNFSLYTHHNRENVKNILTSNGACVFDSGKSFKDYRDAMQLHRYVASPRGNGIDCHRTWEALYFGCIPVVEKHFMYDSWDFLPIIQIEDWNKLDDVINNMSNLVIDRKYLDIEYWYTLIKNYAC
jgi:hypothetical protein